jgi:hypothetical protein
LANAIAKSAVGIDGELCDVEIFVPNYTFNGRTRLALIIEDERLSTEDPPAISDMRVEAHRWGLATCVDVSR